VQKALPDQRTIFGSHEAELFLQAVQLIPSSPYLTLTLQNQACFSGATVGVTITGCDHPPSGCYRRGHLGFAVGQLQLGRLLGDTDRAAQTQS
jgi:hypothetical protein